jgi:hypothetical protein
MTTPAGGLPKSWPPTARRVLLDAARYYYREMSDPFPVPDVIMERAIDQANREIEARQSEIYEEASDRWINRWESGSLDEEMRRAIDATFQRMRRAERPIRARPSSKKKSSAQLDAEIAQSLAERAR